MAVKRNFFLNNNLVEPPKNSQETVIELNFDKGSAIARKQLSITDYEWVVNNAELINQWHKDGNTFVGLPYRYELERLTSKELIFDGYLDFTENAKFSCESCTITAKERARIDWLNDVADSVSFAYLKDQGKISIDDYISMPYVINSIPNYRDAFIALLSITFISIQIAEQIEDLLELTTATANPFEFTAIIRVIMKVIFIITLLVTLILLIRDMINLLVQPVKYHACMRVKKLLEIGASHFGLTFKSDIFDKAPFKDLVIMPEKYFNPTSLDDNRLLGFFAPSPAKQRGYPTMTFGDLLREVKKMFKAKIVLNESSELIFVPEDYQVTTPQYQLPDLYQPFFTTNADELKSNYLINFATDLSDKNTIQDYTGNSYQVITTSNPVPSDIKMNLIKGFEQVDIAFARASRKTELTVPEKIIKEFLDAFSGIVNGLIKVANGVIDVVNGIIELIRDLLDTLDDISFGVIDIPFDPPPIKRIEQVDAGASITNRIGMLQIETDFITSPKIFLLSEGSQAKYNKISETNSTIVSSKYLWQKYHAPIVSFVATTGKPNASQYVIKEYEKVPFTFLDYQKVKNNNAIFTSDGKQALVESLEWNDYHETAKIKVRISTLYTTKLKETYLEPTGI